MPVSVSEQVLDDLKIIFSQIKEEEIKGLKNLIYQSERLFFAGTGRSKLMLKAAAMRFMQFGYQVYLIGETNTPAFKEDDLLIAASGSGETKSTILYIENAKKIGGKTAAFTASIDSTVSHLADQVIEIPVNRLISSEKRLIPGGSFFEQALLILGDSLIVSIAEEKGIKTEKLFERHANLE